MIVQKYVGGRGIAFAARTALKFVVRDDASLDVVAFVMKKFGIRRSVLSGVSRVRESADESVSH